uniref:Polymerase n=1 Tax=Steinernema glaseri TaxID=37863 RepID=A0A1I8AF61_9BILA
MLSLLAGSRGGWIALPAVLWILAYAYLPKQHFRRGMAILSLAAALSASILWQTDTIQSRIALAQHDIEQFEAGNSNTSIGARFAIWQANWKLIQERPLSGWSYRQHEQALTELVKAGQADAVVLNLANSHNNYIETWVDLGLSGLLLQILLLLYCFYGFIRRAHDSEPHIRAYAVCGSIVIAVYTLANLTQNMMERNNTLLFLLISIALFWSQIYPNQTKLRSYMVLMFAFLPSMGMMARILGLEPFGIYTLLFALIGYASMFDLGISRALIRAIAMADKQTQQIQSILGTATLLILFSSGVAAALVFLFSPLLVQWLNISPDLRADSLFAFRLMALSLPFLLLQAVWLSYLEGLSDFKQVNIQRTLSGLLLAILPLLAILYQASLSFAVLGLFVGRLITCVLAYFWALPTSLRKGLWHWDR